MSFRDAVLFDLIQQMKGIKMNYLRKEAAANIGKTCFRLCSYRPTHDIRVNPLKPMRPKMDVFHVL